MKLQMAIDRADIQEALALTEQVASWVDIVEVGTPVIMRWGLEPVRQIKAAFPKLTVLADTKIVDGGALECGDAVAAGADIVTVLALADEATITEVVKVAHENGRKVMADLITVSDIAMAAKRLLELKVDYICVHTGVDAQKSGRTPMSDLRTLLTAIPREQAAVAGGICLETLPDYAALKPGILIAGSALAGAEEPSKMAQRMKEALV